MEIQGASADEGSRTSSTVIAKRHVVRINAAAGRREHGGAIRLVGVLPAAG
jgi:hypothetical protein